MLLLGICNNCVSGKSSRNQKKELIDLSVQQILDCSDTSRLSNNASGESSNLLLSFDYIQDNDGVTNWDRYPFPYWKGTGKIRKKENIRRKILNC